MTALSPGPWTLRCGQVFDADGRWLADVGDRGNADGIAMASAHEALTVLAKLVARAQEVADALPRGGRSVEQLLEIGSAVQVGPEIIREALDALKKAGVR